MEKKLSRRDFLKLAGLLPISMATPSVLGYMDAHQKQNVIIIVFDAWSAHNVSIYGYDRETTPNLARLVERAVIYHNHYSSGNSTMPGTASILTGTYPWKHRGFGLDKKTVEGTFTDKNIFSSFESYYRLAYTHNPVANRILDQFYYSIEEHVPLKRLFLSGENFIESLFNSDKDTASVSWVRAMKSKEEGFSYSLFLARILENQREKLISDLRREYPVGIPHIEVDDYFLLEDAVGWLGNTLGHLPEPYLGYFHFLPPHRPYLTHRQFHGRFDNDAFIPVYKPEHVFTKEKSNEFLIRKRIDYDEFILYVDREFGKLMEKLEQSGILENTWVILTSDHGEMFERGIIGHITNTLYQPVIRVPLVIFEPGRETRTDIYTNTSAVDLLPTLLHITGQRQVDWCEGRILPPYSPGRIDPKRPLYVVQARKNDQFKPIKNATIAMVEEPYKLKYYFGYDELGGDEQVELFDVVADPEEMNDLSSVKRETANDMLHKLKSKLTEVNEPYL